MYQSATFKVGEKEVLVSDTFFLFLDFFCYNNPVYANNMNRSSHEIHCQSVK